MKKDFFDRELQEIYHVQHGEVISLKETIGEENFMRLFYLNYLNLFLRRDGSETWRISDNGIKQYKFLSKL